MHATNTNTKCLDLNVLDVKMLAKMLRALGHPGDYARVLKADQIALADTHSYDEQVQAMFDIGASQEDVDNMTFDDDGTAAAKEATIAVETAKAKPAKAAPAAPAATDAEQVNQIAVLLAQMMATSKGAIDADKVAEIVSGLTMPRFDALENKITENNVTLAEGLERAAQGIVADALANMPARKLDVTHKGSTVTIEGRQHMQFELLLKVIGSTNDKGSSNLNVWLTGMPGTGKTHAASMAATALGMAFYTNGSIANKYELTGFVDAHGKLVRTPFRDAWEKGGLYLFDEVDGSVPAAVLAFNAALANGIMAFPDGMIHRHPNCIIIAAANTTGQGATAELVGRMKQDAAFLDRFVMMAWMLDEALETHLCSDKAWAAYVQQVRANVATNGVKVSITPRATLFGAQLLASGIDKKTVVAMTLKKGMSDQQWNMVK